MMSITIGVPNHTGTPARTYRSTYTLTRRDLKNAAEAREHLRLSRTASLATAVITAPAAFICACALAVLVRTPPNDFTPMFFAMYLIGFLLSCLLLFRKPLFIFLNLRRKELKQLIGHPRTAEVSPNGITSADLGTDGTIPWKTFKNSGTTRRGLFLDLGKNRFLWLPADSFETPEDWKAVCDMARKRLPKRL